MPGGVSALSDETLIRQVRTLPGRPADGVVRCVYESFVPGGKVVVGWGCGEDKICGARSRSLKCIAAARLENTSSSTDGFQRHPQILSSPPPQRLSFRRDERLRQVCRPSAGLRRLIVSRSKCGENLVVATTCICLRLFF